MFYFSKITSKFAVLVFSVIFLTSCTKFIGTIAELAGMDKEQAQMLQKIAGKFTGVTAYMAKCQKIAKDKEDCGTVLMISQFCLGEYEEQKKKVDKVNKNFSKEHFETVCNVSDEILENGQPITMGAIGDKIVERLDSKGLDSKGINEFFNGFEGLMEASKKTERYEKKCRKNGYSQQQCQLNPLVAFGCGGKQVDKSFLEKSKGICVRIDSALSKGVPIEDNDMNELIKLVHKVNRESASRL